VIKKRENGLISKDEAKTKLSELEGQQARYDKIIDGDAAPKNQEPKEPKVSPAPLPKAKTELKPNTVYATSRGPAKWNGTAFEPI